jgi:hypothetical protein
MTRERRSLWGSISTSKKVNALSNQALILYVFTIPHLDDEGYIDGDPKYLKSQVVPYRNDIPLRKIPSLIDEISGVHHKIHSEIPLWVVHKVNSDTIILNNARNIDFRV